MKTVLTGILALSTFIGYAQKNSTMKRANCVEMVSFKPQKNVTDEQLMEAMRATNPIVKNFEGFISRTTSINEKGEFLDIVYWESKEQALQAAQKVQNIPEVMKNFALIDPNSITMEHFDIFESQH